MASIIFMFASATFIAASQASAPPAGLTAESFDRPVKPKPHFANLFNLDDYPVESVQNREAGAVGVAMRVGKDGRVSGCIVEQSSGYPALDTQTCRIVVLRAQFEPAKDSAGNPVESGWRTKIRWELPEPAPISPSAGQTE